VRVRCGEGVEAVAAQGYRMLTEELRSARESRRDFLEVGVAYVRFAVSHRAHFEVMYRPELYRRDDAEVREARDASGLLLYGTASPDTGQLAAGAAAWSLVHGIATLWLNGNLPQQLGSDPEEITRLVARYLSPAADPGDRDIGPAPAATTEKARVPATRRHKARARAASLSIYIPNGCG
jgi:hypothetical protein